MNLRNNNYEAYRAQVQLSYVGSLLFASSTAGQTRRMFTLAKRAEEDALMARNTPFRQFSTSPSTNMEGLEKKAPAATCTWERLNQAADKKR